VPKAKVEYATAPKFSTLQYRYETLLDKLENNTINDIHLQLDIVNNYRDYCNYDNFHDPVNRKVFQKLWTNVKFLKCFYNALEANTSFDRVIHDNSYYRTCICKIAYDYYHDIGRFKDTDIVCISLINLTKLINRKEIMILGRFMHQEAATFIAMAKYSSFKANVCIKRVNTFIVKLGYDFDVKNIIDIYAQLYREDFGILFNNTMTDVYIPDTEEQKTEYNRQNTALATILESMPEYDIKNVVEGLYNYIGYLHGTNQNDHLRFSLNDLKDEEFPRIKKALKELYN
jgi:hypothetical protein